MKASHARSQSQPLALPLAITSILLLLLVVSPPSSSFVLTPQVGGKQPSAWRQAARQQHLHDRHLLFQSSSNNNHDSNAQGGSVASVAALGLNELQTAFRSAAKAQDFERAGTFSDELLRRLFGADESTSAEQKQAWRRRMSWKGLGASPWLVDRLDSLDYEFPTTIQICTMEAVNRLLEKQDDAFVSPETSSIEDKMNASTKDVGVIVSGATGSGKTLAYLTPLLSTLSETLFMRQRLRVSSEESVGDTTGDLLDRIAVVTSPVVRTTSRRQVRNNIIATGASLVSLGKSGKDVRHPVALILVPTRELGVQIAMLLYELIGGNVKKSADEIRGKANSFRFKGPKGVRIGCVLDDEEAEFGLKLQTDVAITTPSYLGKLVTDGDIVPSKIRVVAVDEADLVLKQLQQSPSIFDQFFAQEREFNRLTLFAGASVTQADGNMAADASILPKQNTLIATATRCTELISTDTVDEPTSPKADALNGELSLATDLDSCLDKSLIHEMVVAEENAGLLVLVRLLREELDRYTQNATQTDDADTGANASVPQPRVVIFFPNEDMAQAAISPLRDALWGRHNVGVLLPTIGFNPLTIMEQFKNSELSVLLATPTSVRGLDFEGLTHVYTMYLPADDPREYIHLAGRVGRVGQLGASRGGGRVVSILKDAEASKMKDFATKLGFETTVLPTPTAPQLEAYLEDRMDRSAEDGDSFDSVVRQYLEDSMNLLEAEEVTPIDRDASGRADPEQ